MAYNVSFLENGTTIFDLAKGVNDELGGAIAILFLFAIFITSFVVFIKREEDFIATAFFSSFITSLFTFMFFAAKFVAAHVLLLPIVLTIISFIILIFKE